jgi:GMP synthase-like glutamine amidotransferase
MRVQALYHVPFEDVGSMASYFAREGHRLSVTRLWQAEPLPAPQTFDMLIVMGGPMGVADEGRHPWLADEKRFIEGAMARGQTVLGICLGAQLMAHAAGAAVTRNGQREIGWFPVTRAHQASGTVLGDVLPPVFEAFHWHGDTFALPAGAVPLGSSEACPNQGFIIGDRQVGLQFHLETTPRSAAALIENCRHELAGGAHVQDPAAMLARPRRFEQINTLMEKLLDALTRTGHAADPKGSRRG